LAAQNAGTNQRYLAGTGRGEEGDDKFYQVKSCT